MIQTAPLQGSAIRTGVGFSAHRDVHHAVSRAAEVARAGLGDARAHLALVLTAGDVTVDPVSAIRDILGPVGIAGGAVSALLTEEGVMPEGVMVVSIAVEGDAATGVATVAARDLTEAGRAAARIVMAGWPFRLRYPRGLGITFAAPVSSGSSLGFLEAWRQFMGPKMRTVSSVLASSVVYGTPTANPVVSVAALEAPYATGLGYAEGFGTSASTPDASVLIQGTADAVNTALKRLDEHSARLVLVLESQSRHDALGASAALEWARVQSEVGEDAPCVGWVCDRVAGYGRGIQPIDEAGSLLVAAIGDPPSPRLA